MKTEVAITKCFSYNTQEVYNAVETVCNNSLFPYVERKYVLVKPNILSDAKEEECITTNPEVVRAVIRLLKEKGASRIIVGDSPGLQPQNFNAKNCGIGAVCKEEGIEFVDFTSSYSSKRLNGTKYSIPLTDYAFEADVVISVCKFKTHMLMYSTGASKNLFGLVPGLNKSKCHLSNPTRESFAKLIVGINETVKPQYCIMDAVIGMEGAGPANGKPKAVNLIMGSSSCYAMDYTESFIMGYTPLDMPIVKEAAKRNLLPEITYPLLKAEDLIIQDFDRIPVSGKTKYIKSLIIPFFTKSFQKRKQKKEPGPIFNSEKCIKCKKCINICPAVALTMKEEKVTPDYSKCIRCYCCHEMCPVEAITIPRK